MMGRRKGGIRSLDCNSNWPSFTCKIGSAPRIGVLSPGVVFLKSHKPPGEGPKRIPRG